MPLWGPSEALAAKLSLVNSAERTLDVQYYLWASDTTGYLLLDRLIAAANRGVRVRFLVDDLKLRRRSRSIASLCQHPNLEVRVFNPWSRRSNAFTEGFEFIHRFRKLNRRMHNKLLIADGQQAICGGRNVADEHYGLGRRFNFVDFDVLLAGDQVIELSQVFDGYWQSEASVSGATLASAVSEADLAETISTVARECKRREPMPTDVIESGAVWNQSLGANGDDLAPGALTVVSDTPRVAPDTSPTQVIGALRKAVDGATRDLVVVTPFFVPSETDVEWYGRIVKRGVRIRILTNSLASNPGTISNSGLKTRRASLIRAGVELQELRMDAIAKKDWEARMRPSRFLGLHAKLYVIDRERVFLGSVNLDPRSKFINTEIGVLIDDRRLASECADRSLGLMVPENAWRVGLDPNDQLVWRNDTRTVHRQPARSWLQRVADRLLGLLPIERYI